MVKTRNENPACRDIFGFGLPVPGRNSHVYRDRYKDSHFHGNADVDTDNYKDFYDHADIYNQPNFHSNLYSNANLHRDTYFYGHKNHYADV